MAQRELSGQGKALIIELALAYVETLSPDMSRVDAEKISSAVGRFLDDPRMRNDALQAIRTVCGRDDPFIRIEEILHLPEEPLPYTDDYEIHGSLRKKTRTWTGAEDIRLLGGVVKYGTDNWQAVAQFLGSGRNRSQCSQRWTRGLNPKISKKAWTTEEEKQLEELVKKYGEKNWARIASIMGNRSDVQCRYHYKQIMTGEGEAAAHRETDNIVRTGRDSPPISPLPGVLPTNQGYMSIMSGRGFPSSPVVNNVPLKSEKKLMIPLSAEERREVPIVIDSLALYGRRLIPPKWGVCGSDPVALGQFLRQFE